MRTCTTPPDRQPCRRAMEKEEGSGTILVTAICALVLICLLVIVFAGALYSAKARLNAIADLGALAGADASATAQWDRVSWRATWWLVMMRISRVAKWSSRIPELLSDSRLLS